MNASSKTGPSPAGTPSGPAWWKVALATAVIFAAGVVTGGLLVAKVGASRTRSAARPDRAMALRPVGPEAVPPSLLPAPGEWPRRLGSDLQRRLEERRGEFLLRAARELKLRPEQRVRIEQIVRESQDRIRQLWESVQPDIRRELADAQERIRKELTPEQRRAFERLLRREPGRFGEDRSGLQGPPPVAPHGDR
ncbi:MAG: hypothetical protein RMN51_10725 [Verrucomicrobiota bacterium]|nr:hypothetical protein [Verrucomicrobiota bacterium]